MSTQSITLQSPDQLRIRDDALNRTNKPLSVEELLHCRASALYLLLYEKYHPLAIVIDEFASEYGKSEPSVSA